MICADRYKDKVALITGAASGIGLATACRMAAEGARIILVDIHEAELKSAEQKVKAAGAPDCLTRICDIAQSEQVAKTVQTALGQFKKIDVIVNCAGLMIFKPLVDHTTEDWLKVLSVDLLGTFYFIQQGFLHMQPGGSIINVASVHAVETTPLVTSYAAAKAAVLSLTRSAAIEGKAKGLRVNAVLPGAVATPMLWENPNIKAGLEVIQKKDVGQPEDIASVIAYLGSDDSHFVQGASLLVDGGRLAQL